MLCAFSNLFPPALSKTTIAEDHIWITWKEQTKASSLKDTWFRSGGYTSTLTVPATPDGLLAKQVRKKLDKERQPAGTKVKVLEDGGRGARRGLVRSNQFPREKCQRLDCQLCFQADGKRSMCEKENVGYEGECTRCPPRTNAYIGETSMTGYTRLSQHLAAYRAAAAAREPAQPQPPANGFDSRPKAAKS